MRPGSPGSQSTHPSTLRSHARPPEWGPWGAGSCIQVPGLDFFHTGRPEPGPAFIKTGSHSRAWREEAGNCAAGPEELGGGQRSSFTAPQDYSMPDAMSCFILVSASSVPRDGSPALRRRSAPPPSTASWSRGSLKSHSLHRGRSPGLRSNQDSATPGLHLPAG